MLPDLDEIKLKRHSCNLTQTELARLADVSQSLIAKLESGKIVPTYDKTKRLFDALEEMHESSGIVAKDLMTEKIRTVQSKDSAKKAIKIMQSKALSQLPVMDDGKIIGLVSEKDIVAKIDEAECMDISGCKVADVMGESPPTIQENTPLEIISHLLAYRPAVLVLRRGKIKGIITKADMLGIMLKKSRK